MLEVAIFDCTNSKELENEVNCFLKEIKNLKIKEIDKVI